MYLPIVVVRLTYLHIYGVLFRTHLNVKLFISLSENNAHSFLVGFQYNDNAPTLYKRLYGLLKGGISLKTCLTWLECRN